MPHKDQERRNEQDRVRYAANPGKFRAKTKAWRENNKEKRKAYARAYDRANRAAISAKEIQKYRSDPNYRARILEKNRRYRERHPEKGAKRDHDRYHLDHEIEAGRPRPDNCDICGGTNRIVFDHCHQHGHFRGWICQPCNVALGMVHDDEQHLLKLIAYLRRNKANSSPQLVLVGI